jgi:hypothetical protein
MSDLKSCPLFLYVEKEIQSIESGLCVDLFALIWHEVYALLSFEGARFVELSDSVKLLRRQTRRYLIFYSL